jgi:hypothetical protein
MHIEEIILPGGHIAMVSKCENCPICETEMINIISYGEVCPNKCENKRIYGDHSNTDYESSN